MIRMDGPPDGILRQVKQIVEGCGYKILFHNLSPTMWRDFLKFC
jgi:hypothetical protein